MKNTADTKKRVMVALVAGALFSMTAATASAELKIVTTVPDLAALAAEIGGQQVSTQSLANQNEDPHYVDPKPSHVVRLNTADMLIINGLELEVGWLPPLQRQARNPAILNSGKGFLDASTCVRSLLEIPAGNVDRSHGDIHKGGNPHFIHDPRAMAQVARCIGDRMAELDPASAADFRSRAQGVAERLEGFASKARKRFEGLEESQKSVVTYHRSMVYLIDWLGLERPMSVEPKPGVPPTPRHTAKVLKTMKSRGISVILQESYYPRKTTETLAKLSRSKLILVAGGAGPGQTYLARMERVAEEIYNALTR